MIQIGEHGYSLNDPAVLAVLIGGALALVILLLLVVTLRRTGSTAQALAPLSQSLIQLGNRVQNLSDGQQQLTGGLTHVSEASATAQAKMLQLMEARLADVTKSMTENLQGSSQRTARSLGVMKSSS